jgi:hypothetical protein
MESENREIFEIDGKFIKIEKDLFEIRERYMERVWFILNKIKIEKSTINFDEFVKLSRIRSNIDNLGCEYNSNLKNNLK